MSKESGDSIEIKGLWIAIFTILMVSIYCYICYSLFRSFPDPCHSSQDISCQNLNAAQTLNIVTLLGIFVSGIGTVALVITVYYSHKATNAAAEAVKIANATAQQARDMSYKELRPYIFAAGKLNIREIDKKQENVVVGRRFEISWKNEGKTPAINVASQANYILSDGDLPANFNFPNRYSPNSVGTLGPGGIFNSSTGHMSLDEVRSVINKKKMLYIYGWVEYDEFSGKKRHRTEYCSKAEYYNSEEPDSSELEVTYYMQPQFNDMDENCRRFERDNSDAR